jgi:cytochrome P450
MSSQTTQGEPKSIEAPRLRLVSTRLGPPVEMARWLMELRSIAYAEEAHAPGFHAFTSWRYGVNMELPLVLTPEGPWAGVRAFLDGLDEKCRAGEKLYGDDEVTRSDTRALIDVLYQKLFRQAVAIYYVHMLKARQLVLAYALNGAPWWEAFLVRALFPLWRRVMVRGLGLETFDMEAALADIDEAFALVESRTTPSRPFLHGAAPGTADIIFAAFGAPLVLPERFGASLPHVAELPAALRAIVERYRARAGGRLIAEIYRQGRPAPQPPMVIPREPWSPASLLSPKLVVAGARLLPRWAPRLSFKNFLLVSSWREVCEVLERDNDFRIGPINKTRIEAVSGPFILGMDRCPALYAQREVVYGALHTMDWTAARAVLRDEPPRLVAEAAERYGCIDVVNGYARLVAARTAKAVFGIAGPTEHDLMRVARAVFQETFLNLTDDATVRDTGVAAGRQLSAWIADEVARRQAVGQAGSDVLGRLMTLQPESPLGPENVSWMLGGLLVGAIDTTATAVANIVAEMIEDPDTAQAMAADIGDDRRFLGWCYELLRRRPHNPIVLRRTENATTLGDKAIAAGTTVIAVTIAGMQDAGAYPCPKQAIPTRPLGNYLHFGHGLHLCSGINLNGVQIPALVRELARYGVKKHSKLRTRGPFPDEFVVSLRG